MNWQEWKSKHQEELFHIAGYEEKFVDLVLMKIPDLNPEDVYPQYPFEDNQGKNRYIDFVIYKPQKNWLLPIELDGYAKMVGNGNDYERFQDFLERQNAMMRHFKIVLRYSNKAMFNQSERIVREITDTLNRQLQEKSTKDIQDANIKQTLKDYENKIAKLQNKRDETQNTELFHKLEQLQQEIKFLKTQLSHNEPTPNISYKNKFIFAITFIALLIFLVIIITKQKESAPINLQKEITEHKEPLPINKYQVGKVDTVCGVVSEVRYNRKIPNNYLNINGKYPNQEITFTVWVDQNLSYYTGKKICTYGEIQEYKGRYSINVNNIKALKEMD